MQPLGSLHLLASEGDTSAVAFLLDNSADADSRDADGCTALHWAADRGSLEVISSPEHSFQSLIPHMLSNPEISFASSRQ